MIKSNLIKNLLFTTTAISCRSYTPFQAKFKIEYGTLESVYTAAYYMTIARLKIHVDHASISSPTFNLMYTNELERLKDNLTKDRNEHQVIVAKSNEDEVVGYLDIDRRNVLTERFPTPYISDIIIQPAFRRRGICTSLLLYCDDIICRQEWNEDKLYLWVESDNKKAIKLYMALNYQPFAAETGPVDDCSKTRHFTFESSTPPNTPSTTATTTFPDATSNTLNQLDNSPISISNDGDGEGAKFESITRNTIKYSGDPDSLSQYDRILLRKQIT